ncbi:Rdx family-domain-containing protein [Mycena pura]|uniref:Rdx family-domain-containing protein n=1 Tax=Mycena pura TaxID=153505 RepID=A0AAD6YDL9_9AGAR|nr:Rdx family-domain-containing protein [Mycena pura]
MSSNPPEQSVPLTFVCPSLTDTTTVTIEFCDRCRWLHRASWVQTELLLTFPPPEIGAISLVPRNSDETAGRFRVWVTLAAASASESDGPGAPRLVWDRKVEGGFPVKR